MNKDSIFSIVRLALTAIGAYLVGQNVFGAAIDNQLWETIVGVIMTAAGTIWGIVDKSATIESIQSGVRSVVAVVGGLLVASGKLKAEVLTSILGIIAIIVPYVQSETSKAKVKQLDSGKLETLSTGKVVNAQPKV